MLARVFVFFGGLLVIALFSLLLAPFFVDWAGYRSSFEREASRIIGQPVRVEGTAKARILPFPSVTFSNVVIEGTDGTPAARISSFSMDAELAPLLNGEILIFDMRIDRPEVQLTLLENGSLLWALPKNNSLAGNSIALENVKITDGRVTINRAGQAPVFFSGINGNVSAQALNGPWLAEGRFIGGNTTYDAKLTTAAALPDESLRMRLSLLPREGFYDAAFDGRVSFANNAPQYSGTLDLTALGFARNEAGIRQKLAQIKGDFSADVKGINLTNAVLTAGPSDQPYRADGTMGLTFGENARFDVALKGQQISFGDIEGNTKSSRVTLGVPLAERLAVLQTALTQIPLPDIPGRVALSLPALVVGDTIIRNA
ncbi:MAG: AsmA family protein, partial [Notoacmeibacter sp.]